ncbi:hypothetical protein BU26DRAFT_560147 [Trematosphaeria pertusa]|uniref:Heterokaryon incompatibility domain-containing protein n=1 Tax=Trematosphaeria pertusa TaxID=390896 RepID=A0A6A6IQG6_9PLEO|nr:uncharacterized protein BU26DRAFT_560147 [Trematosphaeria pertusa]KAF2252795.1 hypothetical protein BU26DRAFT_560147 [Trematosphaeria pertusa]
METSAGQSSPPSNPYRPLDRSRHEIRFLRILPSTCAPSSARSLSINDDPVRCQMEYHDFRKFTPAAKEKSTLATIASAFINSLDLIIKKMRAYYMSTPSDGPAYDHHEESPEAVGRERVNLLRREFTESKSHLQTLVPCYNWDEIQDEALWTEWMKTWLWADLPKEPNEAALSGYIALSYVWARQPATSYEHAQLLGLRKILEDISPRCAELMNKALPFINHLTSDQANETADIFLDGSPFKVGANLENALRALRELPEVRSGLLIWADAICINQGDIEERNVEVTRMYSIYKNSTRVAIWLSEVTEQHCKILEFMNFVGECMGHIEKKNKELASTWLAQFDFLEMVQMQAVLSALPYWYRTWIVQETSVAPNGSFLICGNRRFPWMNILQFVYYFNIGRREQFSNALIIPDLASSSPSLGHRFLRYNNHLMSLADAFAMIKSSSSFSDENAMSWWFPSLILRLASMTHCKDSRDRIYGLMNLFPGDLATAIKPDYSPSTSPAMVMAEFVIAHIKATSTLHMLLFVGDISPGVDAWPSWVPNLAIPWKDITLSWALRNGQLALPEVTGSMSLYHADGPEKVAKITIGAKSFGVPVITCQGAMIDVISETGAYAKPLLLQAIELKRPYSGLPLLEEWEEVLLDAFRIMLTDISKCSVETLASNLKDIFSSVMERARGPSLPKFQKPNKHRYGSDAGLENALAECFTAIGWQPNPQRRDVTSVFEVPRTANANLEAVLQSGDFVERTEHDYFSSFYERAATVDYWGKDLGFFFGQHEAKPYMHPTEGPALMPLVDIHRKERGNIFTTASGYVGATIDRIQSGDELWILFGLPMPAVLRKVDGSRRLVGKVYVPGIMEGEAVEEFAKEGRQYEMVTIS